MSGKLLESVSSKLGEAWVARVLSPAFAFWTVGFFAWTWSHGWTTTPVQWLDARVPELSAEATLLTLAVVALLVVAASGAVVERLTLPVLRLLQGYWPAWTRPFRTPLVRRQATKRQRLDDEWQALYEISQASDAPPDMRDRFVDVEEALRRFPGAHDVLPTRVGNILRAAERNSRDRHGLDAQIAWGHLWLVLPSDQRAEVRNSRSDLDRTVVSWIWAVLVAVWAVWAWWAPVLAVLAAWAIYTGGVLGAARSWSDDVEAVTDLYRPALYRALRLPLPTTPLADRELGLFLNQYLLRGSDSPDVRLATDEGVGGADE